MTMDTRFEQALRSADPVGELRRLAQSLLAEGGDPNAVLSLFEQTRQELRTAGREQDEDAVMDFLDGWCSPHVTMVETNEDAKE